MIFLRSVTSRYVLLVVALWLALLGELVWQHARRSDQPPIYDAATYFQKAQNIWQELATQKAFNPFDVAPTFRPPGTVLMSYPFGFDLDYRGFYLRSVWLPAMLVCFSVLVVAYRSSAEPRAQRFVAAVAMFLSTMPAFYFFEVAPDIPSISHWGLVDNFLGGISALAIAAALRSTASRSIGWVVTAAVLCVVAATIKPSGFVVMAVVGLVWFAISALRGRVDWKNPAKRRDALRFVAIGAAVYAVAAVGILVVALRSRYLSAENFDFGAGAILLMRSEEILTWPVFLTIVNIGVGFPFVAWMVATAFLIVVYVRRAIPDAEAACGGREGAWLGAAALAVIAFGMWFWLYGSGGVTQIRYFVPFALMGAIIALPALQRSLVHAPAIVWNGLFVLLLLPGVNLILILAVPHASLRWQMASGVHIAVGEAGSVNTQVNAFVDQVVVEGHDATVYLASLDSVQASFQAVVDYSRHVQPRGIRISLRVPGDNVRPTAYRFQEMADSDFWVIVPVKPAIARQVLDKASIENIDEERALILAWAARLTADDGVEIVSESPAARILRVTDHAALERAFGKLYAAHRWRPVFVAANLPNRLTNDMLAAAVVGSDPQLHEVRFGDRFLVRAVDAVRVGGETTLRVWWQPLATMTEQDWVLFVHSIDASGRVVADQYVPLQYNRVQSAEGDRILLLTCKVRSPSANADGRLAIGILRSNEVPLQADRGPRDWNGIRLIVTPR